MNIIERVAELLGPLEQDSKPQITKSRELDPIVRAVSEHAEESAVAGQREPRIQPLQEAYEELHAGGSSDGHVGETTATISTIRTQATVETGRKSTTFRVDRDCLRRHGFIQPDSARTPVAECFRMIKSQILMTMTNSIGLVPANVVMVTSALPNEGKTFCAVNLAISIARERDRSVLLVDGDVAAPSIPPLLGLNVERGLLDVLEDPLIDLEDLLCKIDLGKLTLLPAGAPRQHSTELLASDAMRTLVKELAERYRDRVVIFDSPPLLAASEATVLSSHMGQIVVVVEAGRTPEQAIVDALGRVDSSKVAGLVLNKGHSRHSGYGYGYGYGHSA